MNNILNKIANGLDVDELASGSSHSVCFANLPESGVQESTKCLNNCDCITPIRNSFECCCDSICDFFCDSCCDDCCCDT